MADLGTDPSMEDILSSIKRIISEDGDAAAARPRRGATAPAAEEPRHDDTGGDDVLELRDPIATAPRAADAGACAGIVSDATAQATRGTLDMLSRLLVKPEPAGDGTLEGLVREMLRPMLREWLDANLPALVEEIVSREIKRITGEPG